MASSAIIYGNWKTNSDGTHPIMLRVIFDRVPKYISIANVHEEHWDAEKKLVKNTHPNYRTINSSIKTKDLLAFDLIMEYDKGTSDLTIEQILIKLRGRKAEETFFDFLSEFAEEYKQKNKHDEASSIESKGKNIWSFLNKKDFQVKSTKEIKFDKKSILRLRTGKDLYFADITPAFLRKLDAFLEIEKGQSRRYVFNHMNLIRTIYNRALSAKLIKKENYPFEDYGMNIPESQKIGLDKNEVEAFEKAKVEAKTETWIHAKNAWLFSFSFGGQRISDVLTTKWEDLKNGKLHYVMRKNNKPVELIISKRAQKILDYYLPFKTENKGYIFPALKDADHRNPVDIKRKLKNAVRIYNDWLKEIAKSAKINKNISPHSSRHTFGNITGDQISPQLLQLIYKHSDIKTTMNYQQHWMNQEKLDKAVTSIVDF